MTIVMATHEMGFARQVADQVCFLDGGVVLERGRRSRCWATRCSRGPASSWPGSSRPAGSSARQVDHADVINGANSGELSAVDHS